MSGRRPGVRRVSAAHPGTPGSPRRPAALASSWRLGARPAGEGWAWGGSGAGSPGVGARPAAGGTGARLLPCEHLKPCGRGSFSPVGGGGQVPADGAQGPGAGGRGAERGTYFLRGGFSPSLAAVSGAGVGSCGPGCERAPV